MHASVRRLRIGELTFHVRTPWGLLRLFTRRLADIERSAMGDKEREAAVEEATRELLAQAVMGCEGLLNEDGAPVTWQPELLDELDAAVVAELVRRLAEPPEELGTKKEPTG
ncbi:MAG: hypothetical protein J7M26_00700 [Armatimonadetes bacterium]|nr:hypothetical protein [Armatimonadota bacterium]